MVAPVCPGAKAEGREMIEGYVYFAKVGKYIKIGHTITPNRRRKRLKWEAVRNFGVKTVRYLLIVRGTYDDESAEQRKFPLATTKYGAEWYHATPELLAYIESQQFRNVPDREWQDGEDRHMSRLYQEHKEYRKRELEEELRKLTV